MVIQQIPKLVNIRYYIGIDGGTNTGFAVWDKKERRFEVIKTLDFWRVYEYINKYYPAEHTQIVIEDPSQNKPVFVRRYDPKSVRESLKIAQDVGGVKRETEKMIEGLERKEYKVQRVRPMKGSMTKLTADYFRRITKYEGSTSEHARDAAMLVFGK